jgi:hypothetical protein
VFMKDPSSCSHVQRHSRPPAAVLRVPSRARNATRHDPHHAPVRTSACSCKAIAVARISYCERQDPCEQCQEVREQPLVPLWPARDAVDSAAFRHIAPGLVARGIVFRPGSATLPCDRPLSRCIPAAGSVRSCGLGACVHRACGRCRSSGVGSAPSQAPASGSANQVGR